ncbi:hypothetical protein RF11_12187 [Thelohanellus kitauei]|uniref:GST C-terminal domain-containing protein n=1 Tax=Thelohanellus kitauei TaxID=669202 RepID=A0A0C2M7K5_THEKT|nr:hypothetical protein RF11_12187 [Thelohanellus kitauei]
MKVKIIAKGDDGTGLPCPDIISMRIAYFLFFKGIDFEIIPLTNKNKDSVLPENVSEKRLPVVLDEDTATYLEELGDIEEFYNQKYPQLHLGYSREHERLTSDAYIHFMAYAKKSTDDILVKIKNDLKQIEAQLAASQGPYMCGKIPSLVDCILFPKLYQIRSFFELTGTTDKIQLDELPQFSAYYSLMMSLPISEELKSPNDMLTYFYQTKGFPRSVFKKRP